MMASPYSSDDIHSPVNSTVVAIDKEKYSHYAVRWAVDHLLNMIHKPVMILVHVRSKNSNHGANLNNDDLNQLFIPYRGYCARKGISMTEVVLDDSDVAKAILDYVNNNLVNNLVMGASSKNSFARSFMFSKPHEVQSSIMKSTPDFCSVYVISKGGKVQSSRPAQRPITNTLAPPRVPSSGFLIQSLSDSEQDLIPRVQRSARNNPNETTYPHNRAFNTAQKSYKNTINGSMDFNNGFNQVAFQRNPTLQSSFSDESEVSLGMMGSIDLSAHNNMDFYHGASSSSEESIPQSTKDIEAEMRRLKLELKQTMDMYSSACKEALTAKRKANELNQWKIEEARKFEKARLSEEAALAVAEIEKAKCRTAEEAAEKAQRMAELEGQRRKQAEMKAISEEKDKDRAVSALAQNDVRYRKYTIEEIEEATERFANHKKIGEGGYGPVYNGELDHTPVAIKVLRPDAAQGKKQFQQEVEVLSSIRHPHMVLLLGACPEYGCLVYEFMENGSLEDRLFRRGNSPPITNYVSKISDVGLARLVPASVANSVTQYHMTSAAGTFCYIDPEYQQTGMLTTKSDVYSLGILLLQIITARPPMGLAHQVSRAISKGTFAELLDPVVPDWPLQEAESFAILSLKCAELRKRDRPDLGKEVVPHLIRLKNFGNDVDLIRGDERTNEWI
ncbi:Protein kinase-like domain superfamily [Arabidopsis suecica]|uniref:RING-type E3 ubiquitin transferase n=1 Tax=Arabidopsis suecica TaxID=45249 RepID=A0A8T1ZEW1_ARASU|nr:Protein kinase-like domain superfamily [Arabidopsis suecica]